MQVQLSTEFALHGLIYLAAHRNRQPIQLAEIARTIKVKESYLRKLFQQMARSGLLEAYKGASGGYALKLNPDQISFLDVLDAVEGRPGHFRCYADRRACEVHPGCQIISSFQTAFDNLADYLSKVTLGDILAGSTMRGKTVSWMLPPEKVL